MGETKNKKKQKISEVQEAVGKLWSQTWRKKKESMVGTIRGKDRFLTTTDCGQMRINKQQQDQPTYSPTITF